MKILLCLMLGVAVAVALPTASQRYMWIQDEGGNIHLLDLEGEEHTIPEALATSTINLLLFTKRNPTIAQSINIESNQVGGNFNPNNPTRFVTHGWTSSPVSVEDIRTGYLADPSSDYNIIMVDWSTLAASDYVTAKAYTRTVGRYIADVVNYLRQNNGLNLDDVQLVGHSLGAQISGVAGHHLNGQAGSVVGLDPALPLFLNEASENRLDIHDGKYVQVIHTDGGFLGFYSALGHIDFYPNNGRATQPGCGIDIGNICSHVRAVDYFAESITTTTGFVSHKCSSWNNYNLGLCRRNDETVLGEKVDKRMSGNFYLSTNRRSPFAQG